MKKPLCRTVYSGWNAPTLAALLGCVLAAAVVPAAASAATTDLVQTTSFSYTINGTETGSGVVSVHPIAVSGDFIGTFVPFDPGLGTLVSFTVGWNLTVAGSIDLSTGVSMSTNGSGALKLAGVTYSGTGGGNHALAFHRIERLGNLGTSLSPAAAQTSHFSLAPVPAALHPAWRGRPGLRSGCC